MRSVGTKRSGGCGRPAARHPTRSWWRLTEIERWARAVGDQLFLHVHEENPRARALYERAGYRLTGATVPYTLDRGRRELEMGENALVLFARKHRHPGRLTGRNEPVGDNGPVTIVQPTLDLWDEPAPDHRARILAHSTDRVAWLRARSRGITATDVARLSTEHSLQAVIRDKRYGSSFGGNAYTDHGTEREPAIARWVQTTHQIEPSTALFHAAGDRSHLATPDGVSIIDGAVVLAEIKTTTTHFRTVPRSYLRQIWWQQYVLGAERTLFVWEQHENFVPVNAEPHCRWIDRDDNEIHILVGLANRVLATLRGAAA